MANRSEPVRGSQIAWQVEKNMEVGPAAVTAGDWSGDLLVYGVPEDAFETRGSLACPLGSVEFCQF